MRGSTKRFPAFWAVCAAAVVALTFWAPTSSAAISDCIDATCRISAGNTRGTGCVFERSKGYVFVLTNAHVVGVNSTVLCEFFKDGHISAPIPGRVVERVENDQCDAAIVALSESSFGGLLPKVVPVAKRESVVRPGETVVSVGCAGGSWSTGWKGRVLGYRGWDIHFVPPPADGRSGSALFDAEGTQIVGLVRARTGDSRQGIACSVQALYQALGKSATEPGVQCPGGLCPPPQRPLLPFRRWQQAGPQQDPVWPTMPGQVPAPSVDLSETNQKLDEITELLKAALGDEIKPPSGRVAPLVPVKPPPDEKAEQRLEDARKAAEEVRQQTTKLQEGLTGLRGVVQKLAGDVETLPDRFQARVEKVRGEGAETTPEVARAYVKDLVAEKLSEGTLGFSAGKLLGAALGFSGPLAVGMALAGWLVSRRIGRKLENGDPLLVTRLFAGLADRIDDLRDRLARDRGNEPAATRTRE